MHLTTTVIPGLLALPSVTGLGSYSTGPSLEERGAACSFSIERTTLEKAFNSDQYSFSSKAILSFKGEGQFANSTNRWNLNKAPTFSASLTVGTEDDVAKAVKLARSVNICFMATSSRNGYGTTMAGFQGGLDIDLSQLTDVTFTDTTVTVGPGITNGMAPEPVDKKGFQVAVGSCTCVSTIGAVAGGGVNRWSGVYGMITDGLVSARVVTYDGSVITASDSQNPDLLWGLHGAAANFGIIVAATYKLRPQINNGNVYSADMMFTVDKKEAFYSLIEEMTTKQPAELSISSAITYLASAGSAVIATNFIYHGTEEGAKQYLEPFVALGPMNYNASTIRWTQVSATALYSSDADSCVKGTYNGVYSANVKKFDAATFESTLDKMVAFYDKYPEGRGSLMVYEMFPNQASLKTPDSATAYPWREARGNFMFHMVWTTPGSETETASHALAKDIRSNFAATSGFDGLSVYVNYAFGDETLEQRYGASKLPQLATLKKKWDPENVFSFSNPLPLTYP